LVGVVNIIFNFNFIFIYNLMKENMNEINGTQVNNSLANLKLKENSHVLFKLIFCQGAWLLFPVKKRIKVIF